MTIATNTHIVGAAQAAVGEPKFPPIRGWAPCQEQALQELLAAVAAGTPLVELRGPPGSRGNGVTTVLRALAATLGARARLLGVASTLGEAQPERSLFDAALQPLRAQGVIILDDVDLAVRPDKIRASRNAGEHHRGAGQYAFEDPPEPSRLLKALCDEAESSGGVVVFSAIEEMHARYMQGPLVVQLRALGQADVEAVLAALAPAVDATAVSRAFPAPPSFAELRRATAAAAAAAAMAGVSPRAAEVSTVELSTVLRSSLPSDSAVPPEEVERIDLAALPGMGRLAERLETHVLYPLINPDEARRRGLMPKRGVLLHGPPGTGKTTVGRFLAHRLSGRFFMIKELLLHKEIMEVFAQARAVAPSVVFFDDIDVLLGGLNGLVEGARGHDLTRFLLSQMDGLRTTDGSSVVVVMTVADAKFMPPAILRSGRIELWLKTEKPKARERKAILQSYVERAQAIEAEAASSAELESPLLREPLAIEEASAACEGFVAADLRRLVSDARNIAAADGSKKCGGEYLHKAATELRAMKEEVEGALMMYT